MKWDLEQLLTLPDAARLTTLSKRKLQEDMAAGALGYVRFGRAVRFKPSDLAIYIEARRISTRRPR